MRRTLILAPRAIRTLETSLRVMETPVKMSEKKNLSPAQLAARKERKTDHKQLMENLDVELKEVLIVMFHNRQRKWTLNMSDRNIPPQNLWFKTGSSSRTK
jgi:hypothetical protein